MQIVVGYVRVRKIFRRKWREIYTPVYKDIGKGQNPDKALKIDLRRET